MSLMGAMGTVSPHPLMEEEPSDSNNNSHLNQMKELHLFLIKPD
jgi:hypothetical protein